jgi:glycosyltransferase involved in cell wall biosynthesis
MPPLVSFVVPAYNEAAFIASCVRSIQQAAGVLGLAYEIVVANDASTDDTGKIARAAGARVVDVSFRHIAAVRNAGAREARGERLVFVDADSRVDAAVLRAAMAALDAGAVGGGAGVRFEEAAPWWAYATLHVAMRLMRLAKWAAGSFVFCTRAAFDAAGGFDERFYASEEISTSRRLKKQGRFVVLHESLATSARKVHGRTFLGLWWSMTKLVLIPGSLRRREALDYWYRDRR